LLFQNLCEAIVMGKPLLIKPEEVVEQLKIIEVIIKNRTLFVLKKISVIILEHFNDSILCNHTQYIKTEKAAGNNTDSFLFYDLTPETILQLFDFLPLYRLPAQKLYKYH
jgi:ABC-type microcin C transport system permease subunit YejE